MPRKKTNLLILNCGTCGSPSSSAEKYCIICGRDIARSRAKASSLVADAYKSSRLQRTDLERLYLHFVFGSYREQKLASASKAEVPIFLNALSAVTSDRVVKDDVVSAESSRVLLAEEQGALESGHASIGYVDYCQAITHLATDARPVEVFRYLFQIYDSEGNDQLKKAELLQLLSDHIEHAMLVRDDEDSDRAHSRLYTWVKKFSPRYGHKDGYMSIAEGARMLAQEHCNGHTMMSLLSLNTSIVAKILNARDQDEFKREARKHFGSKVVGLFGKT